jgi:hypothetical protein
LVRKPEGKIHLRNIGLDGVDNIKTDLKEIWYERVDRIQGSG